MGKSSGSTGPLPRWPHDQLALRFAPSQFASGHSFPLATVEPLADRSRAAVVPLAVSAARPSLGELERVPLSSEHFSLLVRDLRASLAKLTYAVHEARRAALLGGSR